jgi:DNA-binding NtrC family response regulator
MGRQARPDRGARPIPETHVETLSPESATLLADFINAIRATPARDLRTTFEQVVARRANVMRVRLRPIDPASASAAASTSGGTSSGAGANAGGGAHTAGSAHTGGSANTGASASASASASAAAAAGAPPRRPSSPEIVTVTSHGALFMLDAEPHTGDREHVTRILRAAALLAGTVLRAQGLDKHAIASISASHGGSGSGVGAGSATGASAESTSMLLSDDHNDRLVGSGPLMAQLRQEIEASARTSFAVLIEGESGVGKELVARQIHACSPRRRGPFVPVNCAAVVESLFESELFGIEDGIATGVRARRGKFEQANGGTLFLDEIAELPLPAQAKLLRVVQDFAIERVGSQVMRHVDVRLVVATNRSLCALVDEGHFRRDLYFRLRALHIRVAPLRERREDIVEIAEAYLRRCDPSHTPRLSRMAAGILCLHHWPGNVRELERALEYAVTRSGGQREILTEHLAADLGQPYRDVLLPPGERDETLKSMKSRYARFKFEQYRGNKRRTCEALDISYHTLVALLRRRVNGQRAPPPALPGTPAPSSAPATPGTRESNGNGGTMEGPGQQAGSAAN